jgi:selenocysteine lyase/cysteine desulfurase
MDGVPTRSLARQLATEGIFVWGGNYYALEFTTRMGLEPEGMIRVGLVHYNLAEEIDRLIESLVRIRKNSAVGAQA